MEKIFTKFSGNNASTSSILGGIKVTNAVYRILDSLPEQDPLKSKAKEKALMILEKLTLIFNVQGWASLQKEKASALVLDDIEVLKSYLNLGRDQGWIDNLNFLIITKEYNDIKEKITPPEGFIKQTMQIAYHDLESPVQSPNPVSKDMGMSERRNIHPVDEDQLSPKALARHTKILEILTLRQKAQVSDLIKELPNITKRTIRRDLDDLLKKGKVVRIGEWNQVFYQLADRTI